MAQVALAPKETRPQLVVAEDDDALRLLLAHMLEECGYAVHQARTGREAMALIWQYKNALDAVVVDRNMPEIGGMQMVAMMKESRELRWLPIIMETVSKRPKEIREGIDAGVFYYLTKPIDMEVLKSVMAAASREMQQHRALVRELTTDNATYKLIENCSIKLRTFTEADPVAGYLANFFPDAERVISGLSELIYNAIEHGNLGISYDEKTLLLEKGVWREEVNRRAELDEHKKKYVDVNFKRTPEGCFVSIKDQGRGFNWRDYLYIDPARAADNHGRGIAQANMVNFDKLSFNDRGNEVTAFASNKKALEW